MLSLGSIARPFVSGAASAAENAKIAPAPRARERTIFFMTQLLRSEPHQLGELPKVPFMPELTGAAPQKIPQQERLARGVDCPPRWRFGDAMPTDPFVREKLPESARPPGGWLRNTSGASPRTAIRLRSRAGAICNRKTSNFPGSGCASRSRAPLSDQRLSR